ncbi:Uma2 family endonuclease [Catalinimonas alkaloidigena]|nr:hypothetical protein [Catalinimonas alkaloidigena]MDF9800000.1 Uma2 family endonuclease [Catalinimonas alkaloidigena]
MKAISILMWWLLRETKATNKHQDVMPHPHLTVEVLSDSTEG